MSIKSPEAEALIRRLAALTGDSFTGAVVHALRERLDHLERQRRDILLADQLDEIARRCAALPILDARSADEIIGYDETGIPR